ncbi:MAG TPA: hydantoinase/oxoprolinase family protein [Steroidobacteraceae bacterium]|nr:hydantoinase/oxoprolinase family protein [Steroidobacteraceae bacterium]
MKGIEAVHGAGGDALWLGLDTGGTYTDAVLLADGRRVIASAKALTTPWDLAVGIGEAIRAVLEARADKSTRAQVQLVSVSTTLATNAVVENRFSPVATILIGFDEGMLARSGLRTAGAGPVILVRGGHDATGEELEPLDELRLTAAVTECSARVEGYAVAACFSVRNPAHELRARQLIRTLSGQPVTCAHELSSRLDAPRRALTAALNARLTPQISHLLESLAEVLRTESIDAPLMIVKGDGSLMKSEVALEYPVETILSGPAASVVGAGFLTGFDDFLVADMGGTTTDCAVVSEGRPAINAEGALVGGWRTMVEAIDVRTVGLGGDSQVTVNREGLITVGPRKAMPLCLLAHQAPAALIELRKLVTLHHLPDHATQFALRNPGREAPAHLSAIERRVWNDLTEEPKRLSSLLSNAPGLTALRRLADAGLATIAAFTPTDALHVLGRQHGWNSEAAELGARLLANEERNIHGASEAASTSAFCERTVEHVIRESARIVAATALAYDPGLEAHAGSWGRLGDRLIDDIVAGRPFAKLLRTGFSLATPLVAIGAPVAAYYPEVARRLGSSLSIPEHAAVCNAVGAVAGVVSQTIDILVNQPSFGVFRVHDPAGSRDFKTADPAIDYARRLSQQLALQAARRAGAPDPHVETDIIEHRAHMGAADYLAEALVRSIATGRPFAGHLRVGP